MASFISTVHPTPFGFYDSDSAFQAEADSIVTWVKRRLGDDILSVELTSKQIWSCFEEATQECTRYLHEFRIRSELVNALGLPTGSDFTNKYPRQTLEYLLRLAEPYGSAIGVGGSYDSQLAYFDLVQDRQDYNLYTELQSTVASGSVYSLMPSGSKGKIQILEMFHFEPYAGANYLMNSSNVSQFLANSFNYESYANSAVFYVLPIYEDVLRRGMLEAAFRVRRSNYSYQIIGGNVRIFPIPTVNRINFDGVNRLYLRIYAGQQNPYDPTSFEDDSIFGVSGPNNIPYGNIPYNTLNQPMKAWIRQMTLALCLETLGRVRSKIKSIPIPGDNLELDGAELLSQAQELKSSLIEDFKEMLEALTTSSLLETQANQAEALNRSLRFLPNKYGIKTG